MTSSNSSSPFPSRQDAASDQPALAALTERLAAYRGVVLLAVCGGIALWVGSFWVLAAGTAVAGLVEIWYSRRTSTRSPEPTNGTALVDADHTSRSIIESAVDHLPGVFFVVNESLQIERWSDGVRNVSGYSTDELRGKPITSIFWPDSRDHVESTFTRILKGESERIEADLATSDGRRIPLRITGTPIQSPRGMSVVGTGLNILEKRRTETQLEQQERQYKLLAENISDVVTLHDEEGHRLYVSPSVKDLVGRDPDRLFGTLPWPYIHPSDRARVKDVFTFAIDGTGEVRTEYRIQHEDGHYMWVESIGRATSNTGGEAALLVVTRDVTTRKKRETALMKSRERLSLQKRRLRLLYDVISQQDRPTDEQLQRVLDLGTDLLGVDVGMISQIGDGVFTIEASTHNDDPYRPGSTYPIEETYSSHTIATGRAVSIRNIHESEHDDTPYHRRFGLGQYLGAPIYVDGKLYGALSFASERPRSRDFSDDDRDFLRALVQWVRAALKSRTQERALANSQRLLEKAEQVSNVGGWVYDDDTDRFTHTDHLAAIFEVDDSCTLTPADGQRFFGGEAWSRLMRHMFHAYNEGVPFDVAVPATTGTGRRVWLRISGEVEPGENASRRIWGTVQDITDRREVEDELSVTAQRLESLLTSLHEGVLVEDQHRQVRLINEPFCRLFAIQDPPKEIIGTDARDLAIASRDVLVDPDITLDQLKALMESDTSSIGERVELKDGSVLECDYVPIRIDGKRFGHLWKYRDVTLREEREAKLRSAKETADKARDEAKRAERLKSIFLANMSHEIRTPLTSIIGFAEVLEEEVPEPYDHLAGLVGTSGRRLLNTISSVLDLSKLEAKRWQLDVETINVVSELEEAMEVYQPRATDRSIQLEMEVESSSLLARADYAALQRVLDNLVGNALKFTPEGGTVRLRAQPEADAVSLVVEDTGPGIGDNMLDHLFEPFVQSPDETADTAKGSGLGLAITRRLVTAMHGSIELDESYAEGARFCIELPIPAKAHPTSSQRPPKGKASDQEASSQDASSQDASSPDASMENTPEANELKAEVPPEAKAPQEAEKAGDATDQNGAPQNGTAPNGTAPNGTAPNDTAPNGAPSSPKEERPTEESPAEGPSS